MSIQDLLAQLQQNYLASVPDKIALIQTLWQSHDLEHLETEYHKLKGTGRTYGLPEFTLIGAALERLCQAHVEHHQDALPVSVPASINLMTKARDSRLNGRAFDIENDPEFTEIVARVEAANNSHEPRRTGS